MATITLSKRLNDIFTKVRYYLGDDGYRWDDDRLLMLIDEAQDDINFQAEVLVEEIDIEIVPNKKEYTIEGYDVIKILRAEDSYNRYIPIVSVYNMDHIDEYHNTRKQRSYLVKAIVFRHGHDVADNGFVIYPITDFTGSTTYPQYVFTGEGVPTALEINGSNNLTTSASSGQDGVITGIESPSVIYEGIDGVIVDLWYYFSFALPLVRLYILRKHKSVFEKGDLDLPSIFDKAVMLYIVGRALRDFHDTQNIAKAELFLQDYSRELRRIKGIVSSGYTNYSYNKMFYRRV